VHKFVKGLAFAFVGVSNTKTLVEHFLNVDHFYPQKCTIFDPNESTKSMLKMWIMQRNLKLSLFRCLLVELEDIQ